MSMLGLLAPFARLLKPKEVDIYGTVFRLHCKLTVLLFLAFSALVSAHEFFGKPMDCVGSDLHQVDPYINNYCWINGTFTVSMSQASEYMRMSGELYIVWFYIVFLIPNRNHWCPSNGARSVGSAWRRAQVPSVLPMGEPDSVVPGDPLLYSGVRVENLGTRTSGGHFQ